MVLPIKANTSTQTEKLTALWLSPDEWMIFSNGVVKGGKKMLGQKLIIPMEDKNINVTVADPVFFDKEGERLNAKL